MEVLLLSKKDERIENAGRILGAIGKSLADKESKSKKPEEIGKKAAEATFLEIKKILNENNKCFEKDNKFYELAFREGSHGCKLPSISVILYYLGAVAGRIRRRFSVR